jgi:pimeloyl-ACP methyl ester carboxylesterase
MTSTCCESLENRRLLATYPLVRLDGESGAISADRRTWVIVHGWQSSPSAFSSLASAIRQNPRYAGDQIVGVDWSQAAASSNPFSVEAQIQSVGVDAAQQINTLGVPGANLNLIGHSFGAYVAAEIAERVATVVRSLTALDPGVDLPGGYDAAGSCDFSRNVTRSVAYHAQNTFGDAEIPQTAERSVVVDFQDTTSDAARHSAVVPMLAGMFLGEATVPAVYSPATLSGADPSLVVLPIGTYSSDGAPTGGEYDAVAYTTTTTGLPIAIEDTLTGVLGTSRSIHVMGTPGADRISLTLGSTSSATRNGVTVSIPFVTNRYVSGGAGNDTISGSAGAEVITGGLGSDEIRGNEGDDTIHGQSNADTLRGGPGDDSITGGTGNDQIRGDDDDDFILGDTGIDRIRGNAGNDTIRGGGSNDKLYGDAGDDLFYGQAGIDRLFGGEGSDTARDSGADILDSIESLV